MKVKFDYPFEPGTVHKRLSMFLVARKPIKEGDLVYMYKDKTVSKINKRQLNKILGVALESANTLEMLEVGIEDNLGFEANIKLNS